MPANIQFKRGLLANLPAQVQDGTIYVTTDESAMYIDNGTKRIRLGDFIPVNTVNDLPATGHAYETALYYVKTGNILARWNSTSNSWVQINKAGVVGVNSSPTGNVVTDITTTVADDGTLRLVVTKASVATTEELDRLKTRVENLEDFKTSAAADIAMFKGDANTAGSILNAVATATAALLGSETQYTTFKALADEIRTLKTDVGNLKTKVSGIENDIENLQDTVSGHTTVLTKLDGDANTEGSVLNLIAAERTARESEDTGLTTRIGDLENDVEDLSDDVSANTAAITLLNKTDGTVGSVKKTVDDAIAAIVANAPNDFDTLKEISDWISTHADSAASMNTQITNLGSDVSNLQNRMENAEDNIDSLKTRMTTAEGNITTAQGNITTIQGQITTLNGDSTTQGSVDYKIANATSSLTNRVEDLEDDVGILTGSDQTEGSVAYQVAQEASARGAADTALGARIDGLGNRMTTAESNITTVANNLENLSDTVESLEQHLTWISFDPNP